VKPLAFPLLADENIHPEVITALQQSGSDVKSLSSNELGSSDQEILSQAFEAGRVVLTHDSDFGWLAVAQAQPVIGIIYLRPGHIQATFTLETLRAIDAEALDVHPPFIIVAERSGNTVNIRVRQL
jgi:predicted nuclease of predicted toxin-antitoxin system